jgi:hypothetical protein
MKRLKKFILITIMLNVFYLSSYGQNMGADITWRCLGGDSFLIKMTVYNDCNFNPMVKITIDFTCATTGVLITSMNLNAPGWIDATPVCPSSCTRCQSSSCTFLYGIRKYIYLGVVHLNTAGSCCSIRISNSFGTRSGSITTGAAYQPFYTEAKMNRCLSPCDNSPEFTNIPVPISCIGQPFILDNKATDHDTNSNGKLIDSFTYEFGEPLSYPNSPIPYNSPYTYDKPINFYGFPNDALPFPRGIHLDPQTGELFYQPMIAQVTVMVIRINEYRNKIKIAELRREIQAMIIACPNSNSPAIVTPQNVISKNVCAGSPVTFDFSTNDPNVNDTVTISWNHAIPGAKWTDSNGLSKLPSASLTWTPTDADVRSLPYIFMLTAKDNSCPINSRSIQRYRITVTPRTEAKVTITNSGCGKYWFNVTPITGIGPTYLWQGQSFSFTPDSGSTVYHEFKTGIYPFTMTMTASGCDNTYYDTIIIDTFITNTLVSDTTVCYGSTINLKSNVKYNSGHVKMKWGSGSTVYSSDTLFTKTLKVTRNMIIWSVASDSTGCESKDSVFVRIHKQIGLNAGPDKRICSYGQANITAGYQVNDAVLRSITWTDLKTNTIVDNDRFLTTSDSSLYKCRATDTFGCTEYDTIRVVKSPEVIASVIGQTICYGDIADLDADTTGGGNAQYLWYEGTKLVGGTKKIKVNPTVTTDYWLKVSETISGVTCKDSTMVRVRVNPLPVIIIKPIDKRCINGTIISLDGFVIADGTFRMGGIWSSPSAGLIYADKFNPMAAGESSPPGWKVIYEYMNPATGCYNKDSSYVTIYALPKPFAGEDESVCKGTKKTLTGVPLLPPGTWRGTGVGRGSTNWWFNPDTVGVVSGGTYDVIYHYTDNHQCENEDIVKFKVKTKPPTPIISLSPIDSFLECVLLNGLYQWFYRPDFFTTPTIISYANRIDPKLFCKNCYFCVIFTDSNGCLSDTSAAYNFVYNSIDKNTRLPGLTFYPNPAHSELFVENPGNKTASMMLTDIYGKTLLEKKIKSGKSSITIQNYKPGIYFIFMDGLIAGKLIVE